MMNLMEMMLNAQNGAAVEQISRQFDLTRDQTVAAMEALMPAFSQGLKRNTADPYDLGAFLQALASGNHAKYMEDMQRAFTPGGVEEGNGILGHLFGSKELSRSVAAQAAQATGIGQDILQRMLPILATMVMGGLFKQSTGQMGGGGLAGTGNPFGEMIEQWMRQSGMGQPAAPRAQPRSEGHPETEGQPNPFDNPFGKMLEGMLGGGARDGAGTRQEPPTGGADNPFGRMFEEMMRGAGGAARSAPRSPDKNASSPEDPNERPRNPYDDLFGQMFEAGRQTRDDYQRGMESIFDQFRKGMDRQR